MFGEGHLDCTREKDYGVTAHDGKVGAAQHTLARHIEFHLKNVIWGTIQTRRKGDRSSPRGSG